LDISAPAFKTLLRGLDVFPDIVNIVSAFGEEDGPFEESHRGVFSRNAQISDSGKKGVVFFWLLQDCKG